LSKNNAISVNAISNMGELLKIENSWNKFIRDHARNPFFLSGFFKEFMSLSQNSNWTPTVLIFSVSGRIVGIAPLATKTKLGVRMGKFLLTSDLSPDFILDDKYQEVCFDKAFDYIFSTLHCKLVFLIVSEKSPSFEKLKQLGSKKRLALFVTPARGHRILPVRGTWAEFETFRGRNFRRKFKGIERNLDRFGPWRISCIENGKEGFDVVKRIFDIEKMSWKEEWRVRKGKKDADLLALLEGSQYVAKIEPCFKWNVWFLDLNNQAIAYSLFIEYKGVSYCVKTSYDRRYKRLYPGIYVINAAICEFFNRHQIRKVDFLTDLFFHKTWTSLCSPRVRIMMARSSVLLYIANFALSNKPVKGIFTLLSKRASSMADLIGS
jgi:CelD/BcsL family acetyltransferase involved in cellulose biosynthesis